MMTELKSGNFSSQLQDKTSVGRLKKSYKKVGVERMTKSKEEPQVLEFNIETKEDTLSLIRKLKYVYNIKNEEIGGI